MVGRVLASWTYQGSQYRLVRTSEGNYPVDVLEKLSHDAAGGDRWNTLHEHDTIKIDVLCAGISVLGRTNQAVADTMDYSKQRQG